MVMDCGSCVLLDNLHPGRHRVLLQDVHGTFEARDRRGELLCRFCKKHPGGWNYCKTIVKFFLLVTVMWSSAPPETSTSSSAPPARLRITK